MYNKQLEELIRVAMQDGVITEKERKVLLKKAESFGIDPDELDMVLDARLQEAQANAVREMEEVASNPLGMVPLHDLATTCKGCGSPRVASETMCPRCGHKHKQLLDEFKSNLEIARQRAKADTDEQYAQAMKEYEKQVAQRAKNTNTSDSFWGVLGRVATSVQNMVTKPNYNDMYNKIYNEYRGIVVGSLVIPSTEVELMELLEYFHEKDLIDEEEYWHSKKLSILAALERRVGFFQKIKLKRYKDYSD